MSMSEYRIVSLTEFRRDATRQTEWVRHQGGRVWISKHGKLVCAVVPMFQCQQLEDFEGRSLAEERRRLERLYQRWKAVKNGDEDSAEMLLWQIQNDDSGGGPAD
ncbi:MAG: hypothetical protein QGI08_04925 [Paracoccaceae bacterium]|nr:hypothetical protein [Paracoccaceae bacterium]MDP7185046.1 hypothetical protein [Paracoccaceae bacterium]